ncbi:MULTISPECIES: cobalt-precorrin 5A hydrolase [unclassified Leptospira]|uniref:cobalt-precorrin 5A hydrolase n=1 Tax=unclassified Leptospira TaxID=2633828 RepID=UPI0002BF13B4|nr:MULTISPECIES: cobalamin biosynthesis protein [unclassified Leptospira]EMK01616.1 cobalamin biosynthesis protein [Leptospira sp. B5-022]MCR1795153.1 cobalamin biosynthesis protein [Leptospira sp. id769339]
MIQSRKPYAIYVITKHGMKTGKELFHSLKGADLFVSPKFISEAPKGSKLLSLPMEPTLRETFMEYDCHIFAISVGAVVRMISPLLVSKKTDPAVLCIDDQAKFTICVLSGHVGRGNFFTQKISGLLENIPVITTASDVSGTLTVDILGRELGWSLEDQDRNVTRACAAVVNETKVMFVQETGEPNFWPLEKDLPKGIEYSSSLEYVDPKDYEILLIASDRTDIKIETPEIYSNSVIYRPKSLVLGLGCDKGIPTDIVENGIVKVLKEYNLSLDSIKAIASVDAKKEEPAFLEISEKYGWEFRTFSPEKLDQVEGISEISKAASEYVGTRSVSEAAALLLSGSEKLLVTKQKYKETEGGKNLTVAIARIPFAARSEHHPVILEKI